MDILMSSFYYSYYFCVCLWEYFSVESVYIFTEYITIVKKKNRFIIKSLDCRYQPGYLTTLISLTNFET